MCLQVVGEREVSSLSCACTFSLGCNEDLAIGLNDSFVNEWSLRNEWTSEYALVFSAYEQAE